MNTSEASAKHGVNPFDILHVFLLELIKLPIVMKPFIGNIYLIIYEIDESQYIQGLQKV
jgi:hypothetical protein